jgi:hypothetical protein
MIARGFVEFIEFVGFLVFIELCGFTDFIAFNVQRSLFFLTESQSLSLGPSSISSPWPFIPAHGF